MLHLGHLTNVHKIFKRESLDTALLARIGQALNHNFFEDLARSEQAGRENPATEA